MYVHQHTVGFGEDGVLMFNKRPIGNLPDLVLRELKEVDFTTHEPDFHKRFQEAVSKELFARATSKLATQLNLAAMLEKAMKMDCGDVDRVEQRVQFIYKLQPMGYFDSSPTCQRYVYQPQGVSLLELKVDFDTPDMETTMSGTIADKRKDGFIAIINAICLWLSSGNSDNLKKPPTAESVVRAMVEVPHLFSEDGIALFLSEVQDRELLGRTNVLLQQLRLFATLGTDAGDNEVAFIKHPNFRATIKLKAKDYPVRVEAAYMKSLLSDEAGQWITLQSFIKRLLDKAPESL